MPFKNKKEREEEFEKTELSQRISGLELFAKNHGWAGWQGQTIQDYFLTSSIADIDAMLEFVGENYELSPNDSEYEKGRNDEMNRIRTYLQTCRDNLKRNDTTNNKI